MVDMIINGNANAFFMKGGVSMHKDEGTLIE